LVLTGTVQAVTEFTILSLAEISALGWELDNIMIMSAKVRNLTDLTWTLPYYDDNPLSFLYVKHHQTYGLRLAQDSLPGYGGTYKVIVKYVP